MSTKRWWYALVPEGSVGPPSEELKGFVLLPANEVVFGLKDAVYERNKPMIGPHSAISLRVFENDNETPVFPTKPLSECTSGEPQNPFIIHYPGRTLFVCMRPCS